MAYDDKELAAAIIGKKVMGVYMDHENLIFDTDQGRAGYYVTGDCCSDSSFHDFLGVDKLIAGGPVLSMGEVEASELCQNFHEEYDYSVENYGYEFVVMHPEFGEVTAVVSFRNSSNGYYGGSMELSTGNEFPPVLFATTDILEIPA